MKGDKIPANCRVELEFKRGGKHMRKKLVVLLMVSALGLTGCGPSLAKEVKELVKQ